MYKPMSIWDTYSRPEEEGDSMFLRNVDFGTTPRRLKFTSIEWREQRPETPEIYRTKDGRELMLTFEEAPNATKRAYTAKGHKNALVIAMKAAGIELNDTFDVTREGEGIDTRFTCNKVREDGTVEVKSEAPF